MKLEDIHPGLPLVGLEPSGVTTVDFISWIGAESLRVVYRTVGGALQKRLLGRTDEPSISVASVERPWSFDGDGEAFQLACEAGLGDLPIRCVSCFEVRLRSAQGDLRQERTPTGL